MVYLKRFKEPKRRRQSSLKTNRWVSLQHVFSDFPFFSLSLFFFKNILVDSRWGGGLVKGSGLFVFHCYIIEHEQFLKKIIGYDVI